MTTVRKTFLSEDPQEFGSIQTQVEYYVPEDKESKPWIDAMVRVADCSRVVVLDFHCKDKEQLQRRLQKVDKMIDELLIFKEVIRKEGEQLP